MISTTQTSVQALLKQIDEGKIKTNAAKAYWLALNRGPLTYPALQKATGIKMASATATISNLLDLGMVEVSGEVEIDGYKVNTYRAVTNSIRQAELQRARHREKYEQWKKRGLTEFADLIKNDPSFTAFSHRPNTTGYGSNSGPVKGGQIDLFQMP